MRDLREIELNEGGRPVPGLPQDSAALRDFEKQFRLTLPSDYVDFLRFSNGGHPRLDAYRPLGAVEDTRYGVDRFHRLVESPVDVDGVRWATLEWQKVLAQRVVAFASDGGGNQLLLSFDTAPPAVVLCLHDEQFRLIRVADSFGAFIDLLEEDPDMI